MNGLPTSLFLLSTCLAATAFALQCMDDSNEPVDWYIMYKIPKLDSFIIPTIKNGKGYMIITSNTTDSGWVFSAEDIFSNTTALANTLAPYYRGNVSELWMMYNDQLESRRSSGGRKGHTKGVVGADSGSGFWLVHSVPEFPGNSDRYAYASNGVVNGQSFICISLPPDQLNSLGANVLRYNRPQFYNVRMNSPLNIVYHELYLDAQGASITNPPWYKRTNLTTLSSKVFVAFAKTKDFGGDIYEQVAKDLETDILAETWLDNVGPLPSECDSEFKTMNIQSISFKGIHFNSTKDHSKWAISARQEKPWSCVGDINRAKSQERRGGGTVCLSDAAIWGSFDALIGDIERCTSAGNDAANSQLNYIELTNEIP